MANSTGTTDHDPDLGQYLRADASDGAGPAQGDDIRDMEKSLVERIADVDDDRRRTATAMQKAFAAHRDEVADAGRRLWRGLLAVLAVAAVALAAVLGWQQWQIGQQRARLADAVAALDARIAALPAPAPAAPAAAPAANQAEAALLSELAARVDEGTALIAELSRAIDGMRGDRPDTADAAVAAGLEPVLAAQRQLAADVAELRTALAQVGDEARASASEAAREAAAETARAEAEQALAAAAQAAPAPAAAGPDLDALIDQQLARLEREYQRLAREVAAPAVQPAGSADPAAALLANAPAQPAAEADIGAADSADPPAQQATTASATGPQIGVGDNPIALQLIGFHSRDAVGEFIARYPLPAQVYTREETLRGRPWYVLIHSLHPDATAAARAMAALPPELRDLDIWIRSLPADARLDVIETNAGQ